MKIRYVELPTDRIFNWLDPFNVTAKWACKSITGDWWSDENVTIRKFFAEAWTNEFDKLTGHFTNLEESIKNEGIQEPILLLSGPPLGTHVKPFHWPPDEQQDLSQALRTHLFGGSRVTIAQKLNIRMLQCAVQDEANLFPDSPEITACNYTQWFGKGYSWCHSFPKSNSLTSNIKIHQVQAANAARKLTYAEFGLVGDK